MIETINGTVFQEMILSAAAAININKQQVNELNVFPVPDGDTGTNMSLTMGTAATDLMRHAPKTVGKVAERTAGALLRGARGNSGVILSLLFRGFSRVVKDQDTINGVVLAAALEEGVHTAYRAVMKPAEGTILTVSRVSAKRATEAAKENASAEYVLQETIASAQTALEETVWQNPVLKKAGVIDAGGKGYLIILDGMLQALRGNPVQNIGAEAETVQGKADFSEFSTEDITYCYCTEFIVQRENDKEPRLLQAMLEASGDSLVFVEDDEIIKVHVHTNNPGTAIQEALAYGSLLTVKIENMREQHTEILQEESRDGTPERVVAKPEKKYGFLAVCAGEGLAAVFQNLGVDGIINGGQTMNPSTEDILREIDRTPAEIVYVLPNNKNIIMAAQQCVPLTEKTVIVLPTETVPQGISAMLVLDPDAEEAKNTADMKAAAARVKTTQVTYAARDSEFDGFSIKEGDFIALEDHRLFGTDRDIGGLLQKLAQADAQQNAEFITIYYGAEVSEAEAQKAHRIFSEACPRAEVSLLSGGQPVYYYLIAAE